jgi:hypothetical protein
MMGRELGLAVAEFFFFFFFFFFLVFFFFDTPERI